MRLYRPGKSLQVKPVTEKGEKKGEEMGEENGDPSLRSG
jgi:hypothetical protein